MLNLPGQTRTAPRAMLARPRSHAIFVDVMPLEKTTRQSIGATCESCHSAETDAKPTGMPEPVEAGGARRVAASQIHWDGDSRGERAMSGARLTGRLGLAFMT